MTWFTQRTTVVLPLWVGLVFALAIISGCGKKAPPVAPRRIPLIALSDLQGELNQGTVRLTWLHSPENAAVAGYLVLRAQAPLSRPDCPDCPLVFQKVEKLPLQRSLREQRQSMLFSQAVADGFRYTYSVRPYQSSGRQGPDSNWVVLIYGAVSEKPVD